MTDQSPPWIRSSDTEDQRSIDHRIATKMGITLEELYEIDRQVDINVRARDAVPQDQRIINNNPRFNKGFGPNTPENRLLPEKTADTDAPTTPPDTEQE